MTGPEHYREAERLGVTTPDLMVQIDGQMVPLKDCGWLERESCGCIVSAVVASVEGKGGWLLATAEQAHKHFAPTKRERDKDEREGRCLDLITMAHYRQNIGANWECDQHQRVTA